MYTLQCPVWSVEGILWVLNLWKLLIKCQGAWAIQYCFVQGQNVYAVYTIYLCISHYKLSTCTNTPHWGLTKKSRYKEGVPCQSGNPQPLQVTIHHLQETLYALHSLHNPTFVMFCAGKHFISLVSEVFYGV